MAIDRAATVKKAEILLGEGKLDAAITEYERLVEDQPTDWSAGNTLGDLYARSGDRDKAAAQFRQVADSQYRQGFVGKATAFYKKALRIKAGDEHSLAQLAAIAASQELVADAKGYLTQLLKQRRDRADKAGAAECLVRIAALDEEDGDAKLAAARAGKGLFESERTARLFVESAEAFERTNRSEQAKAVVLEAAGIEVKDPELRRRIAALSGTVVEEATPSPEPETLPTTPAAEETSAPPAAAAIEATAAELPAVPPPPATLEVETSSGQTLSFESGAPAAEAETVIEAAPVVEPVVLAEPEAPAARIASVESVASVEAPEQQTAPHVDLMAMLDDSPEPGRDVRQSSAASDDEPIVLSVTDMSSDADMGFAEASEAAVVTPPEVPRVQKPPPTARAATPPSAPSVSSQPSAPAVSAEVKARFEERLARSVRQGRPADSPPAPEAPARQPQFGDGDTDEVAQLEAAARTPSLEFQASAQLGRLLVGRGDLRRGLEWLERAVRSPMQIPDHAMAVQYEIAEVLERIGESARALEVLQDLEAHTGGYRDVRQRIDRLSGSGDSRA